MRKFYLFGVVLLVSFLFQGCDLLNSQPDDDVLSKIDEKVRVANAPVLKVTVNEGGMGTASPRGTLTGIKQGIPFTLSYSSFAEYGFLGWEAVLASDTGAVLGPEQVEFSPADAPETTVTVKINPGDDRVIIRPAGGLAPVVASISPDITEGTVRTDRVIRIRFSRAIDPASFLFDNGLPFQGDWRIVYHPGEDAYDNRVYKNILIESGNLLEGQNSSNWAPYYYPPELSGDGTILTIAFRPSAGNSDYAGVYNQLTVTLNRDIRDTRGISLGRTYPFIIEAQGSTGARAKPTDSPSYPVILNFQNFVMVKASPPDTARPDGRIYPGANMFAWGDNHEYNPHPVGPSSDPSHHFAYNSGDNWIYLAFQTELHDYAFAGALIYESYYDDGGYEYYSYTGETASPVYDPAIVKPLADYLKETYSGGASAFNPSRPVRVVKYRLSRRTGTEPQCVYLNVIPLDILDQPLTSDDYSDYSKTDITDPDESMLFQGGDSDPDKFDDPSGRWAADVGVWYTD